MSKYVLKCSEGFVAEYDARIEDERARGREWLKRYHAHMESARMCLKFARDAATYATDQREMKRNYLALDASYAEKFAQLDARIDAELGAR